MDPALFITVSINYLVDIMLQLIWMIFLLNKKILNQYVGGGLQSKKEKSVINVVDLWPSK